MFWDLGATKPRVTDGLSRPVSFTGLRESIEERNRAEARLQISTAAAAIERYAEVLTK